MRAILILCLLCAGCGVVQKVSDWVSGQNDCETANGGCDSHAICHPQGQPVCTCDNGFTGDGKTCQLARPAAALTLASGADFTCGLWPDGTLRCWGDTAIETTNGIVDEIHPTAEVLGREREWLSFSAFEHTLCGVRKTGALSCWQGLNGTPIAMPQADPKASDGIGFVAVAAGSPTTCGLKANGDLWCWDMRTSNTPDQMSPSIPWKNIAAGDHIVCAIRLDDTLWCWSPGFSQWPGASTDSSIPVEIDSSRRWSGMSMGSAVACAIDSEGNLFCLTESMTNHQFVVTQKDDSVHWTQVAAGDDHRCVLNKDGAITCWGTNLYGESGDGTSKDLPHPVTSNTAFTAVSVGQKHSCAASTSGEVWCWGANHHGQLGNGRGGVASGLKQLALKSSTVQIATDEDASCAIDTAGALWCWGRNWYGGVGDGTYLPRAAPVHVGTEQWQTVSAGFAGIQKNGSLWAWPWGQPFPIEFDHDHDWIAASHEGALTALDSEGVLWDWDYDRKSQPRDGRWRTFAQGSHGCAIKDDDSLWCQGYNYYGQVGIGTTEYAFDARLVASRMGWSSIAAGDSRTCGIELDGTLLCWGQALLDSPENILVPTLVSGTESFHWKVVTLGSEHICALRDDSSIWCWGRNDVSQLATADLPEGSPVPVQVGQENSWTAISAAAFHTCALRNDGTVWCWGLNEYSELGDDSNSPSVPVKVITQ